MEECPNCDGAGYIWDDDGAGDYAEMCPKCGGSGWLDNGENNHAIKEPE